LRYAFTADKTYCYARRCASQKAVICVSFSKPVLQILSQRSTSWTWAHFRAGQILNPYRLHYITAFAFSTLSSTHRHRHPLRAAFSIAGGRYNIATFHINTLTNDLDAACIPVVQYLRKTDVITVLLRPLTCWLQPISTFGCSFANGTSIRQFTLHSPYHSILAPVRLGTGSYDSPRGSSYTSFIVPDASYHFLVAWPGRILEAELQVALQLKSVLQHMLMRLCVANNI